MRKPHNWQHNPDWSPKTHFKRTCKICLEMAPNGGCMLPFRLLRQVRRWAKIDAPHTRKDQRKFR